jgi:hypothetical protein
LNSIGIYTGNHIATATSALTITAVTDAMNNCKFFNNTINNVYGGISISGFSASSPYTLYDSNNEIGVEGGNVITNLGAAANSVNGIFATNQKDLKVANNIINSSLNGLSTTANGIFTSAGSTSNVDIYGNTISFSITTGTYTSTINGINNAMGTTAASNTINIYNNSINSFNLSAATTASLNGILNTGTAKNVKIYNNTVDGNILAGTGTLIGIINSANLGTDTLTMYSNTISGNTSGGTLYCTQATTATINYYSNNLTDNSITGGSSALYGYYNGGSPVTETYHDNSIINLIHNGTGTVNAIYLNTAAGTKNIYANNINGLSSGGNVNAYISSYGTVSNIYRNNIYNLTTTGTTTQVIGINYSGATGNLYNNFISEIKAPASTNVNGVIGINIGGTSQNLYYNTIYLDASSSSVTTFGTAAIYKSSSTISDF